MRNEDIRFQFLLRKRVVQQTQPNLKWLILLLLWSPRLCRKKHRLAFKIQDSSWSSTVVGNKFSVQTGFNHGKKSTVQAYRYCIILMSRLPVAEHIVQPERMPLSHPSPGSLKSPSFFANRSFLFCYCSLASCPGQHLSWRFPVGRELFTWK